MYGIKIAAFIVIMLVLPYVIGNRVFPEKEEALHIKVFKQWNMGMLLMYALFEVYVLIGTFAVISLRRVGAAYFLTLFCMAAVGTLVRFRKRGERIGPQKKPLPDRKKIDWYEIVLLALVVAGVLYQVLYVCMHMHIDDDDAYYVGMAVTSYTTNTISVYHPYTGMAATWKQMADYVLTPYPIYWAMWSKVLNLAPAILMRTGLPAVNILWCYVVYDLIGCVLFQKRTQRLEFMLIVILANLFGAFSGFTSSVFLLMRIWQGKAVFASVFVPLFWYFWICIRRQTEQWRRWCGMGICIWASCLTSTMTLFVGPALLGAFGLEHLIEKRDWKSVLKLIVCALPLAGLVLCELFLRYWS